MTSQSLEKYKNSECMAESTLIVVLEYLIFNIINCRKNKKYIKSMQLQGTEKILDFGCGAGSVSKFLAKALSKGGSLTCVDISEFWMKKAKKRLRHYTNIHFKLGYLPNLNLSKNSFERIFINASLHEVSKHLLKEIVSCYKELLTLNGKIYVKEPILQNHGIPISDIRSLFASIGMEEITASITKKEYVGIFQRK